MAPPACLRFSARESRHCCQRAGKVFRMIFKSSQRLSAFRVLDVEPDHLIESRAVLAADLPEPRQARNGIKPPSLPGLVELVFVRDAGPRPHEAHLAAQHVDELGKFIQPGGAQQGAQRNQPGIASRVQLRHGNFTAPSTAGSGPDAIRLGIHLHRPEFETGRTRAPCSRRAAGGRIPAPGNRTSPPAPRQRRGSASPADTARMSAKSSIRFQAGSPVVVQTRHPARAIFPSVP